MPFTCPTCFQALSTERSLKKHVRRFHPNMNEEQIMCKTCNIPCTDKYNLKCHNTRFHRDEIPALSVPSIEISKEKNSSDHKDETFGEEGQLDYCEPALNCIRRDYSESHKTQGSDEKKCPINPQGSPYFTEEIPHEINHENTIFPIQDEVAQDKNPGEVHGISNDYTGNLLELSIIQQKNTDFIKQNTSHILKRLEITKGLVTDFESNKIYQAKKLSTKTYNCRACDRLFENSASLATHR